MAQAAGTRRAGRGGQADRNDDRVEEVEEVVRARLDLEKFSTVSAAAARRKQDGVAFGLERAVRKVHRIGRT
jgi:hypothetical protein